MLQFPLYRLIFATGLLTVAGPELLHAQEINWRHDYTAARKEAVETGRPLLLDFGTEACVWCRKQDATTFRDPKVVKLLNEQLIPVKIDAERESRLTQALGIESFPTLVLASAQGAVLGRQVGYASAAQVFALVGKAPGPSAPSTPVPARTARLSASGELLSQCRADYEAGRYAECLRLSCQIQTSSPASSEALEARKLSLIIAGDPRACQKLKEQIETGLASLHPKLEAALAR